MKINRRTVLSTAAVLGVAALIAGGTIAYFTDNDSKTNNFKVGNVDVTLYESQLHRVNANVATSKRLGKTLADESASNLHLCEPYDDRGVSTINSYCTPNIDANATVDGVSAYQAGHVRKAHVAGVAGAGQSGMFSDAQIIADSESQAEATDTASGGYANYVADEYKNLVPGKQIRKFVYVKNTGENTAYVRVKVTIPKDLAELVDVHDPSTPQQATTSGDNTNVKGDTMDYAYFTKSETTAENGDKVLVFVFHDALTKNEMTYWSPINTVKIKESVKESDLTNIQSLRERGFDIKVDVNAIQSDGFASAEAAFQAFDNQAGSETEVDDQQVNG